MLTDLLSQHRILANCFNNPTRPTCFEAEGHGKESIHNHYPFLQHGGLSSVISITIFDDHDAADSPIVVGRLFKRVTEPATPTRLADAKKHVQHGWNGNYKL